MTDTSARSEAAQRAYERGEEDGAKHYERHRDARTSLPTQAEMEEIAGIEHPYADIAEHHGHMTLQVLNAYDKLLDTLYEAYEEGFTSQAL